MRPMLAALVAVAFSAALAGASPVRVVKYDAAKKELTVKEVKAKNGAGEKEVVHVLTDKVKFFDGETEVKLDDAHRKLQGKKLPKVIDLKLEGDKLTEVKFVAKKAKKADK